MDNATRQTVFKSYSDKVVYRIPALFYKRESKTLLAFAEKRTDEDDSSTVALVMMTRTLKKDETNNEVTIEWSELKEVKEAHLDGHRPMNPCPVYDKTSKTLFLFFICVEDKVTEQMQKENGINKARLFYVTTKDVGQSWTMAIELTDKLAKLNNLATFAVGPGHGLQTESGRLIVPAYFYESSQDPRQSQCPFWRFKSPRIITTPYAFYLYSDNGGTSWEISNKLVTKSVECQMAEVSDDKSSRFVYCNARSEGGYRVEALEKCHGAGFITLPPAKKLAETRGGCQGSVVSFPAQSECANTEGDPSQNKWLLFTHPSDKSKRINLGVYVNKSPQDPIAWSKPWIIYHGPSGYSDLAYIDDGWFACLMECGENKETEKIALRVFCYNDVKQGIGE